MKKLKCLLLLILLPSCIQPGVDRVRIVDKDGKPANINKIIPAFNEQQIIKQKQAFKDSFTQVNKFRQDFNDINSVQQENLGSNIIEANNNSASFESIQNYPDDIFADRITNYKYLNSDKNVQVIDKSDKKENNNKTILNKVVETTIPDNNLKASVSNNKLAKKENTTNKQNSTTKKNTTNKKNITKSTTNNINKKGFYIQIGIFNEKSNAENSYKKYSTIHKGGIDEYISKSKVKYKVLLGPYTNRNTAEKDLEKVIKTGHYDVYITEKK